MQKIAIILLAAASSLTVATAGASPRAKDRGAEPPYCLQGETYGYPGYCEFWNLQQCQATASGTLDACGINPRYTFRTRVPPPR